MLPEENNEDFVPQDDGEITRVIGESGKWQLKKCGVILAIIWLPASFHLLNMVFYRAETDFWCKAPSKDWDLQEWRNISSPIINPATGEKDPCFVYDIEFTPENRRRLSDPHFQPSEPLPLKKCEAWDYDRSFWKATIIQEWDLVCDRKPLRKLTQQTTFFGLLVGVFVAGVLSDKYGRINTTIFLLGSVSVAGTLTAFSPSYEWFLVGVWLCGFCTLGAGTILYCWMMEIVSGNTKTILGCAPHFNYAFWGLSVAAIAYCVPDWRKMQLIFSAPLAALLLLYWILPESPRWLHTHGHDKRAEEILRTIVAHNSSKSIQDTEPVTLKPLNHHHHHNSGDPKKSQFKGVFRVLELFKTPNLRRNTLITYFMWFATSIVYYGLTLNSNDEGSSQESIFIYYSAGKLIEIPAVALVILLIMKTGRRLSSMLLFFGGGISLLCTMFISKGTFAFDWPLLALNIFGRGCSVGNLAICYIYSAELFPTVIRNVGIGSSSVWARIGPMIAPFIRDLEIYHERAPIVTFGVIAIAACFLVSFLPETKDHKIPDTLAECEKMAQGDNFYTSFFSRDSTSKLNELQKA